jgi:hypothetical protein
MQIGFGVVCVLGTESVGFRSLSSFRLEASCLRHERSSLYDRRGVVGERFDFRSAKSDVRMPTAVFPPVSLTTLTPLAKDVFAQYTQPDADLSGARTRQTWAS